jgi:hypothetical protein
VSVADATCTCLDRENGHLCKHLLAAASFLEKPYEHNLVMLNQIRQLQPMPPPAPRSERVERASILSFIWIDFVYSFFFFVCPTGSGCRTSTSALLGFAATDQSFRVSGAGGRSLFCCFIRFSFV